MRSADHEVLAAAGDWLEQGRAVYLVTVARTWGSAPRPAGSLMAVREDGEFVGSVSGGCVEDDLAARLAARVGPRRFPAIETYGVTADQTQRFGLPCGGRLDLLIEQLTSAASVRTLLDLIDARRNCARRLCLATGEVSLHPGTQDEAFRFDGADAIKVFGPQWRLLLTGAGQLSRYVAEMALALDYHVVVCDPREEYARTWAVAETELDAGAPDAAVRAYAYDARSALLALAHDPQLDDPALCAALGAETFYVGALGSRANQAKRKHRLTAFGVTPMQLARLHGPVGLPIGARTPAEIAVAILAELTAARHGVRLQAPAEAVPGTLAACRG